MNNKSFTVKPISLDQTIKYIIDAIDKGYELQKMDESNIDDNIKLDYNDCLILKPFYQRDYRSTVEDESSLVESILVGIPIPPVFLCSSRFKGVQVLNVVDGQHRLLAFYRYRKNKFNLSGLPLLEELNGLKFTDLQFEYQEQFISHKLPAFVFRDFPGKEFELEVFNRYNKGTKALTPQEIRNAVYSSPHNEYISSFVKSIFNGGDENKDKLKYLFNVTKDRLLKKKVHEGIFAILYVLEYGINTDFKDSTTYSTEYMKIKSEIVVKKSEKEVEAELLKTEKVFNQYTEWLLKCTKFTPYPISKEIYGISSKQYKFSTAIALILTALYKIIYLDRKVEFDTFDEAIFAIQACFKDSFIENPAYTASSTNSREIWKLINDFVARYTTLSKDKKQ